MSLSSAGANYLPGQMPKWCFSNQTGLGHTNPPRISWLAQAVPELPEFCAIYVINIFFFFFKLFFHSTLFTSNMQIWR